MKQIIKIENVSKIFKNYPVVKNVNLKIEENTIVGIIGRNGSGKTVLLKMICGLYKTSEGSIFINNQEVNGKNIFKDLGILIDTGFLQDETGFKNLSLLASLRKIITKKDIFEVMTFVGLDPWSKIKYRNYSTGMKQRLKFAQAIMEKPNILILDEPFNGLDKQSVNTFREQLLILKKEGKTILMTSHYQEDINLLCDKIYEMDDGKLEEVRKNEEKSTGQREKK